VLCDVKRHGIASYFQSDEVGHHSAAREIATGFRAIAAKVREPAHYAALHRHRGWANSVRSDVLIEGRADEVRNDTHWVGRRCD
jgi:hypothetical protein